MLDLGTYPLHAIADMFTFDMTTHLRDDILAPRGPITRDLAPLDLSATSPRRWRCASPARQHKN